MKPRSEACERNRDPILEVLRQWFARPGVVLEIGSGTGQHAVYFAEHLPHLTWQPTDRQENLDGIRAWVAEAKLANMRDPIELDVTTKRWPITSADYAFTANTAHIMGWSDVELMFARLGELLVTESVFCLYGPVNRDGQFTSESNRAFDQMLRNRDPRMGIRDDQALFALAARNGFTLQADSQMPANNRLLVWKKH